MSAEVQAGGAGLLLLPGMEVPEVPPVAGSAMYNRKCRHLASPPTVGFGAHREVEPRGEGRNRA